MPFELASGGHLFDTEILLQAFFVGAQIEQVDVRVDGARRIRRTGRLAYGLASLRAARRPGSSRVWPGMFPFQFFVVCRPMPGVRHLLGVTGGRP